MLWTGVVILQALSVLSEPTRSEYLSPIVEKLARAEEYVANSRGSFPGNIFDAVEDEEEVESFDYETPTAYFYITQKSVKPAKRDCAKCLTSVLKSSELVDPCDCLPCSYKITSPDFALAKTLFKYFRHFTCESQKQRADPLEDFLPVLRDNNNRYVKFVEEYMDDSPKKSKSGNFPLPLPEIRDKDEQGKTRNYKIEIKMEGDDESLKPTLNPQLGIHFRNFDNSTEGEGESSARKPERIGKIRENKSGGKRSENPGDESSELAKKQKKCSTGDCDEEASLRAAPEKDGDGLKQKVRRVFNDILSKMEKMKKGSEMQKLPEATPDVQTRRSERVLRPDDGKKRSGLGMYRNPYRRPTYQISNKKDKKNNLLRMGNLAGEEENKLTLISSGRSQSGKLNKKSEGTANGQKGTDKTKKLEMIKFKKSKSGEEVVAKSSAEGGNKLQEEKVKNDSKATQGTSRDFGDSFSNGFDDSAISPLRGGFNPIKWATYDDDVRGKTQGGDTGTEPQKEEVGGEKIGEEEEVQEAAEKEEGEGEGEEEEGEEEEEYEEGDAEGDFEEDDDSVMTGIKALIKNEARNQVVSFPAEETTESETHSAGEETKNTPSKDDADRKSTAPVEEIFSERTSGSDVSNTATLPTTLDLSTPVTPEVENVSENSTSFEGKENKTKKSSEEPEETGKETEAEESRTEGTTTNGAEDTVANETSPEITTKRVQVEPNKTDTTEKTPSPTYGDHLTMNFSKKKFLRAMAEGPTAATPRKNATQRSDEDADGEDSELKAIHTLPERPEEEEEGDEMIDFRNLRGDYLMPSKRRRNKSGKRSTKSHLSGTTHSPFRAVGEDWKEGEGSRKYSESVGDVDPKFVAEFEDEPRQASQNPVINLRVNIYSDADPGSVYRFLSRLVPRSAERSPENWRSPLEHALQGDFDDDDRRRNY